MVDAEAGAAVENDARTVAPGVSRAEADAMPAPFATLPSVAEKAAEDVVGLAAVAADDERELAEELSLDAVTVMPQATDHRMVREGELARNSSVGNAAGVVSAQEVSGRRRSSAVVVDRSRSVADDSELLALLRPGW
jgi:hypothetical protein